MRFVRMLIGSLGIMLVLLAASLSALASTSSKPPQGEGSDAGTPGNRIAGSYIVVLRDSSEHPAALARQQAKARGAHLNHIYPGIKGYAAKGLSKADVDALRRSPKVKYVEADRWGSFAAQTVPTGINRAYATEHEAVDIDEEDDERVDVDIAIIDSGIDASHPDLNVVQQTDCTYSTCEDGKGDDIFGHGTHVAGIAGAIDNEIGTVGIAPGARLWGVRVGGPSLALSNVVRGVEWVTEHADSIEAANMSVYFGGNSSSLAQAIDDSIDAGVVYAVAAANEDEDAADYSPAGFANVITVSALSDYDGIPGGKAAQNCEVTYNWGEDDVLARYSNWGSIVDIAAPGSCIYSTFPMEGSAYGAEYGSISGTSMASPYVAGAAALLASESNPEDKEDVDAIRDELVAEGSLDWTDDSGDGVQEPLLDLRPPGLLALTKPATDLHTNSATLNGVVNPGGESSTYWFEYGTSAEYGNVAPVVAQSIGSGVSDLEVARTIDVEPDTEYHYRVVADDGEETVYSGDQTFETSHWSVQDSAAPSEEEGKTTETQGVSCASPNFCMAVGVFQRKVGSSYRQAPYAARWDGAEWSIASVPALPEERPGFFTDVSCSSSTSCVAVGRIGTLFPPTEPLVAQWDGAKWSVDLPPVPEDSEGVAWLNGVSCPSADLCVAVGEYASALKGLPSEARTLVERWDGEEWTAQSSPSVEGSKFSSFSGVSCASGSACVAVGYGRSSYLSVSNAVPLAAAWNGSSWSALPTVAPEGVEEALLEDVSCVSAESCVTVGNTESEKGKVASWPSGYVASWDGSEWELVLAGLSSGLKGASCASPSACVVGGYGIGRRWDGEGWATYNFAYPEQAKLIRIEEVACVSAEICTAVGFERHELDRHKQVNLPLSERLMGNPIRSHAETESTALAGEQSGVVFKSGKFEVSCSEAKFSGTMTGAEAQEVTLHPLYNEGKKTCTSSIGSSSVTTTGCDLVFDGVPLEKEAEPGSIGVQCEAGKSIKITMPFGCWVTIGSQTLRGFAYTNATGASRNYLIADVETDEISYTAASVCALGGLYSGSNGEWVNEMTLKGYDDEGNQASIWGGPERSFHAEDEEGVTNAHIAGTGTASTYFGTGGGFILTCGSSTYTGTLKGENEQLAASSLTLHPLYNNEQSTCGIGYKVNTEGCDFAFSGDSPTTNVKGVVGIECEEGESIHYTVMGCTISMGSQSALYDVYYTNEGGGSGRKIAAEMSLTGIGYTAAGAGCSSLGIPTGEGENGKITTEFDLKAYEYNGTEFSGGEQVGLWLE